MLLLVKQHNLTEISNLIILAQENQDINITCGCASQLIRSAWHSMSESTINLLKKIITCRIWVT